jgi:hypothetical protein
VWNAEPSRVWRIVEDLDTRMRPDGSLRMGDSRLGALLDKHQSVRDDDLRCTSTSASTAIVR